jgi:hypothetical protein
MTDMEEILSNIVSGFVIVDRGHLKYLCKESDSNPRYPLVPLIEIDMNSNTRQFRQHIRREAWVSYSLWSVFQDKHKMDYKSICELIENFMFTTYGFNIKAK